MDILFISNYLTQSSYALQARLFVPRIAALGHKVEVANLGGGPGLPTQVEGITVLPMFIDAVANDSAPLHMRASNSQVAITLCDVWAFNPTVWKQFFSVFWCPIDHNPTPPGVVVACEGATKVVAMSRFGQQALGAAGIESLYIPLAYDPTVWHPGDKHQARAALGIPNDAFYVTFVGVNDSQPSRKGISELLMAWSVYHRTNRQAKLRLHTTIGAIHAERQGVNIPTLIKTLEIDPATVSIVDQYRYRTGIPATELAILARASDMLILPSRGEGFGLPLIEFQACGCPVATTNFAAGAELVRGGWLIEGEPEWSYQSSFQMKPGVASIIEALEAGAASRNSPARRKAAIEGVREYQIDYVVQTYWRSALAELGEIWLERTRVA